MKQSKSGLSGTSISQRSMSHGASVYIESLKCIGRPRGLQLEERHEINGIPSYSSMLSSTCEWRGSELQPRNGHKVFIGQVGSGFDTWMYD